MVDNSIIKAVTERPYLFKIKDDKTGSEREFTIKPPSLGCLMAVSALMEGISIEALIKESDIQSFKNNGDLMLNVVCLFVSNSDKVDEEIKTYFKENCTVSELHELFCEVSVRIDIKDFMKSIVLAKNTTIPMPKTSLQQKRS